MSDTERPDERVKFLERVCALNPLENAEDILDLRQQFLEADDIAIAEIVTDRSLEDYQSAREVLRSAREEVWHGNQGELGMRLTQLQNCKFAAVATEAGRLKRVLGIRAKLAELGERDFTNNYFYKEFCKVLIAPPGEANKIREAQLGWMRPENNPGFGNAITQIKANVAGILQHAPEVYALERGWLNEILSFDANLEREDEGTNTFIGLAILFLGGFLVFIIFACIQAMFGMGSGG